MRLLRFSSFVVWLICLVGLAATGEAEDFSSRVVSQTVGSDELLLALAKPEQIAALSHLSRDKTYSAVAAEADKYPQLRANEDAEGVLAYRPTLVLCADYSRPELVAQLKRSGVRVLQFSKYIRLEDAFGNLRLLAAELHAEQRCEQVIADCKARVNQLQERLAKVSATKVIAPSIYGLIPGDQTTFQDLCDHAAAENLAKTRGHMIGHVAPPSEQMLLWPIDQVVLVGTDAGQALAPFKELAPYRFMDVIRAGRAVLLEPYMISCVSHHRIEGYERLARLLHPEAFP